VGRGVSASDLAIGGGKTLEAETVVVHRRGRKRGFRPFRPFRPLTNLECDSVGLLALLAFRGRRHDAPSRRHERGVVGFEPSTGLTMAVILVPAAGEIIPRT